MPLIPKCMSTQHPDNANTPAAAVDGVLKGDGEIAEAVDYFAMGCDEQMWDSEGKDADNRVVQKLLTNYPGFFQSQRVLGKDCVLTLRVPNPAIEVEMRKSLVEALGSIPTAWDVAREFYGPGMEPPIQEVILPFTTSAEELILLDAYYRKFTVGQETEALANGKSVKDWVGEFYPKRVRVIPLIEDLEHMVNCDQIIREFVATQDAPYQRVFLARSDPALNYGMIPAELMLKLALMKLQRLEREVGKPLYPIIGAGAVPFRGHLGPLTVRRVLSEHPSVRTLTVQSAFKFDYEPDVVQRGIQEINAHERSEAPNVDENRVLALLAKFTAAYQEQVRQLAPIIAQVSAHVPKRRERKLHVGLFGYGRALDGAESVVLPRAISFTAALYSIGVPPELLGMAALDDDDLAFVRDVYPSVDDDLAAALQYANEARVRYLLGDAYADVLIRHTARIDRVHEGLTSAIWAALDHDRRTQIPHYIEEAAQLRRFLG